MPPLLLGWVAVLLFWAPLPFGSVVPWARTLLQIGAFVAATLAMMQVERPRHLLPVAGTVMAVLGIGTIGALQSLAWPAGIVRWVSPKHFEAYDRAGVLLGETLATTLSLAPQASRSAAIQWFSVGAVLLAAAILGRSRRQRRILFGAILLAGLFQVVYGAQGRVAGTESIWGAAVHSGPGRLRGTFVNPDHLAVYLEICLAIAFGAWWWMVRRTRREEKTEKRLILVGVPAILWLVFFVGLAYTGSRAGLLAAAIGAVVQGVLLAAARRRWSLVPVGVLATVVGIATVMMVGLQTGLGRWLATSAYELSWNERLETYRATLSLWAEYPILGTGLGTFRDAFPAVQPVELTTTVWRHAHNDLLELLLTTGIAGLGLAFAGIWWILARLSRVLFDTQRTEGQVAVLAALGALASVSIHELLDFGLTMPANAFTLAVVVGIAAGVRVGKRT